MSIVTDILSLRRNKTSSIEVFLAALEWQKSAQDDAHILSRGHDVAVAADLVLLNVAAHAADALSELPTPRKTRRAMLSFWRKPRRSGPGQLHQRKLFAV